MTTPPTTAPTPGRPLVIDVDATLVTAHSEKEGAAPTFKRGFGHHPLWAFVDHGPDGTGEPVAALLRPGQRRLQHRRRPHHRHPGGAAPTARRIGPGDRPGRKVLIRVDGAGATHELLDWLARPAAVVLGRVRPDPSRWSTSSPRCPTADWQTGLQRRRRAPSRRVGHRGHRPDVRPAAGGRTGMRVIVRKERPHPGAQLRLTDPDGHRYTAFATNTRPGGPHRQLADLELRHRRRARAEDRIRAAKDTGLSNLPLHGLDQNRIWRAIVALACEITAWTQMLALTEHPARRWEPKRLRLRIFSLPAQTSPVTPARVLLHLPAHAPWAEPRHRPA